MLSNEQLNQLRRLMELREEKEQTAKAAKSAEAAYREAEEELADALNSGPVKRINNVDLGEPWGKVSFGYRETAYGRIIPGAEKVALKHYESRGLKDEYTNPKFVMKRLNEEVRQRLEANEDMPPGVDYYYRRGVTVSSAKN